MLKLRIRSQARQLRHLSSVATILTPSARLLCAPFRFSRSKTRSHQWCPQLASLPPRRERSHCLHSSVTRRAQVEGKEELCVSSRLHALSCTPKRGERNERQGGERRKRAFRSSLPCHISVLTMAATKREPKSCFYYLVVLIVFMVPVILLVVGSISLLSSSERELMISELNTLRSREL